MLPTHAEHPGLYAGFWRRAAAFLIDYSLILGAFFLSAVLLGILAAALDLPGSGDGAKGEPDLLFAGLMLVYLVAMVAYYVGFETSALQATPGKLLLRICVVDYDGRRLQLVHGLGRYLSGAFTAILSLALYVGYWICAFTPRKQTVHDLISRTLVVNRDADPNNPQDVPAAGAGLPIVIIAGVVVLLMGVPMLGIVLAIAIPAYQDYTIRAKVSMAMHGIAPLRSAISEYALETGEVPQSFDELPRLRDSLPQGPDVKYQVTLVDGIVVIRYPAELLPEDGNTLGYSLEFEDPASVRWYCGYASEDSAALTTIVPRYLPPPCRGGGGSR